MNANDENSQPTKKSADETLFNEKEQQLIIIAFTSCLKDGPPEIDMEAFVKNGEFKTKKTAQNTWGRIRGKIFSMKSSTSGVEEGGFSTGPSQAKKKRKMKEAELEEGEILEEKPKARKPRKASTKKTPAEKAVKNTQQLLEEKEADNEVEKPGDQTGNEAKE